jgi:hypothetical protein
VPGKGGKSASCGSPGGPVRSLRALRTEETFGEDRVFPMSAVNAWKRVKRAARLAGITVFILDRLGFVGVLVKRWSQR